MFQILLYSVAAIGIVFGSFLTYHSGYVHGSNTIQAAWDTEKAAIATAQRDKEAALQASMDKLRTEKNRETAKLQRTVAVLTDSLRNRPERPADPASSAGDGATGCTGAELYKPDSQFLVGEAARADQIRLALKACQQMYQKASEQYPE